MRTGGFVAAALSLSLPSIAIGWSSPGHKTVCQIALVELDKSAPDAHAKVVEILSKEPASSGFRSFPVACTWADVDKHTAGTFQNKRRGEHYINVPRDQGTISGASCPMADACLFTAIEADVDALKSTTGAKQRRALKFLGHWLGDLHQPLHISFEDDTGGNDVLVSGISTCKELHGTWDKCLPSRVLKDADTNSYITLGTQLQEEITDAQRSAWTAGTPAEWAAEALVITRAPDTDYCEIEGSSCCYPDSETCERQGAKSTVELDDSYLESHAAIVREQMKKAGVRLAHLIEQGLM